MKSKVSSKRAIALLSAVVAMTILILGLSAPGSATRRNLHSRAVRQAKTSACRIDYLGWDVGMKSHPGDNSLIHEVITSAISIADRM
jgi:hypothetical protein